MVTRAAAAAFLLLCACPARPAPDGTAPPRGSTYDEYLKSGQASEQRPPDTDDTDSMTMHVIDIGQGQAILLEFPCGAALVDTGAELNDQWDGVGALRLYLEEFFRRRPDLDRTLSLLLISHPHLDHTRGIDMLLRNYTVDNVVDNGMRNEWTEFDGQRVEDNGGRMQIALQDWARERAGEVGYEAIKVSAIGPQGRTNGIIDPVHGCGRATTDPKIRVLWGQLFEERDTFGDNPNNHSVAVRVDYGNSSFLIPGDLEVIGNSRLDKKFAKDRSVLDVDVYVPGHHGSKNGTTEYMLDNMSPKVAVISAGPYERREQWTARRFGHPNKVITDMLLDLRHGVSGKRPPIDVPVGVRGAWKDELVEQFTTQRMDRAVYCTCWDGSVRVRGNANGWLDVETNGRALDELPRLDDAATKQTAGADPAGADDQPTWPR